MLVALIVNGGNSNPNKIFIARCVQSWSWPCRSFGVAVDMAGFPMRELDLFCPRILPVWSLFLHVPWIQHVGRVVNETYVGSDLRRSEMGLINFSGVGFKYSLKASANTQCLMLLRSYIHKPSFIKKCSLVPFANFHIRRRRFNFDGQPWNSWAGFAWPPPFEVCVVTRDLLGRPFESFFRFHMTFYKEWPKRHVELIKIGYANILFSNFLIPMLQPLNV